MHNIVEGLMPLAVPIESVVPLERNPRQGDVEAAARSLHKYGQRKPIVVNAANGNMVEAGNHVLLGARDVLGWDTIAAVLVEDDQETQTGFALADNRISELGTTDQDVVAQLLREIDSEHAAAAGYDAEDVADLLAELEEGESDTDGVTVAQARDQYEQSTVRSVVLIYQMEQYGDITERLGRLRSEWGYDNNSDVVARLVVDATS